MANNIGSSGYSILPNTTSTQTKAKVNPTTGKPIDPYAPIPFPTASVSTNASNQQVATSPSWMQPAVGQSFPPPAAVQASVVQTAGTNGKGLTPTQQAEQKAKFQELEQDKQTHAKHAKATEESLGMTEGVKVDIK